MISARAFIVAIGALLIVAGAVGLVLNSLRVFETCMPSTGFYGLQETCSQSPAVLIVGITLAVIGLLAVVGGIVVKGTDD